MKTPRLYIVIPCYNEEAVLPITAPLFRDKLLSLSAQGKISPDSRVLFVNDGSIRGISFVSLPKKTSTTRASV